jgi:6-pyruvoyltetrahydropterin/6-carboxytetrahydropterin synthase
MTVSITLSFRWPMGHRILGLEGAGAKCRNVHGHNWQADIELPNDDGALEFGAVKAAIGDWIDAYLDHGFMCALDDPFKSYLMDEGLKFRAIPGPPTTEAIATDLAEMTERLVGVRPLRVHVLEGWRNAATWTP